MDYSSILTFKWYFLHKVKCVFQILTTTEIVGPGEYSQGLERGDMYRVCFSATILPRNPKNSGKGTGIHRFKKNVKSFKSTFVLWCM